MTEELQNLLDMYIDKFLDQEVVKKYLALEKELDTNEEIISLKNQLKEVKNKMLHCSQEEYQELSKQYQKVKSEIENHPLVNNYNLLQEEIAQMIKHLEKTLKQEK